MNIDSEEDSLVKEFNSEIHCVRSNVFLNTHKIKDDNFDIENVINLNKYNDVRKLFRVTASILRFVNNLKDTRKAEEKIYKTK